MEREFFKPAEVAGRLGVSRRRVYQLIRAGEIPAALVGGAIRIPRAAWERWVGSKAVEAGFPAPEVSATQGARP